MIIYKRYRLWTLLFLTGLIGGMLLLVACGSAAANNKEEVCPTASEGKLALNNEEHGYCLLYPEAYTFVEINPGVADLVIDSIMNHTDPRVSISVEDAGSRTAQDLVNVYLEDLNPADFGIEQSTIELGGQEATLLDHMPGQDFNRQLFALHNGRLYHLFFTPLDPEDSERQARFDELYDTVTTSFVFQPATTQ